MARKATASIPFNELKKLCAEKGIASWPEYQKRYIEIPGAKKTLHATYSKEWKGNKVFFGNSTTTAKVETVTAPAAKKEIAKKESKKVIATKTASNSDKKAIRTKKTETATVA